MEQPTTEQIRDYVNQRLKKTEHLEKLYGRSTRSLIEIMIYSDILKYIDNLQKLRKGL